MKKIKDKSNLKNEIINLRVSSKEKNEITTFAENNSMSITEFITLAIKDKMQENKLMDSQSKLIDVLKLGFKESYNPFFKRLMLVLNRIDFNSKWIIKQQDIFMQHIKVPQSMEDLIVSPNLHPITEKAEELVLKDIRKMALNKNEREEDE